MSKKRKNKRSSHPVMFFIYMIILVVLASGIASALNFQVTYDKLTTIAGEVESTTVAVNSLFSLDGLRFFITSAYDNLINFAPFGSLLMASIAFGIALKSGFLKTLCTKLTNKVPKFILVFLFSLLCIVSSVDANVGYVLLLPLGAVLFMSMGRNPIGGLALAFASIASGHGVGLFINKLDYNLTSYTQASANLLDSEYLISQSCNIIFVVVMSLFIGGICTFINEKFLVRRLGRNQIEEESELMLDSKEEKSGLIAAFIATFIYLIPLIIMIIPSDMYEIVGLLLDKTQTEYSKMLFSSDSLLMTNMVGIVSLLIAIQGFVFGVVSGTIKRIRDMVNLSTEYLKNIGGIFVLVFFAAQLSAFASESNLGIVLTGTLSNLIANLEFSFIPLVLLILVVTLICNILIPGSVAKWSIIAPNIMQVVMRANVTPEFAQLIFRAGDSITNIISPLFAYFVIFIGFIEVFTKNKNDFSIRNCYKIILPYFFVILLMWLIMLVCWYIIGLPIGIGVYPTI